LKPPTLRSSPLFSPISITISILFIIAFGVATWLLGGVGFSPGPVSSKGLPGVVLKNFHSHADFESNCSLCHQPLQSSQAVLCKDCHTDVAGQVNNHLGLHGHMENVDNCAGCHTEHKGRSFDLTSSAIVKFDHNATGFPLSGKHGAVDCAKCHLDNRYDTASPQCVSCHQEPVSHTGLFGTDCQTCHSTVTWTPASFNGVEFNHANTQFTLNLHSVDYSGTKMECTACHTGNPFTTNMQACIDCHGNYSQSFMQNHIDTYGSACLTCHDGKDRTHGFTHDAVFKLDGAHAPTVNGAVAPINCQACHANGQFRNTPATCVGCHQEPQIHAGFFGTRCEYCHTTQAWQPAQLHEHTFALDHGGKGEVDCKTCHTSTYATYTCYTCHDHQPDEIKASHAKLNLTPDQLAACTDCHMNGLVNPLK